MKLNRDRVLLLIAALESGEFEQGTGQLREGDTFCCLGVACEVMIRNGGSLIWLSNIKDYADPTDLSDSSRTVLPNVAVAWYGFDGNDPVLPFGLPIGPPIEYPSATTLNDLRRYTFPQIAECFRRLPGERVDDEGA